MLKVRGDVAIRPSKDQLIRFFKAKLALLFLQAEHSALWFILSVCQEKPHICPENSLISIASKLCPYSLLEFLLICF